MMISGSLKPSGMGETPSGDKDLSASRDDILSFKAKFKVQIEIA